MTTGKAAAWEQIGRAGQNLIGLTTKIYEIDSKEKARTQINSLATETQSFHEALLTDPDAGVPSTTPGAESGYMKKWADYDKTVREKIDQIESPLQRKIVRGYWDQERQASHAQVFNKQFEAWSNERIADADADARNITETWSGDSQGMLDAIANRYGELRSENLMKPQEYENMLAQYSQLAIRKTISTQAKAAYDAAGGGDKGLAAALDMAEKANSEITHGGNVYGVGDKTRDAIKQDIQAYDNVIQIREDSRMETEYANLLTSAQKKGVDKDNPNLMTISRIQGSQLSSARKKYWIDQLAGYYNQQGGSEIDKAEVNQISGMLLVMAERMNANEGRGGTEYIEIGGKKIPVTPTGFDMVYNQNIARISTLSPDMAARLEKCRTDMSRPDNGTWSAAFKSFDSIKDPQRREEAKAWFWSIKDQYADAGWGPDKIMAEAARITAEKAYKANFLGRMEFSPKGFIKDDDDRVTFDLWDKKFRYAIGSRPGQPAQPQSPLSQDALRAYQAAVTKEIIAIAGDDPDAKNIWIPTDAEGNYIPVQVREKNGERQTFMSVPVVDKDGNREAGILVCTTKTGQAYFDKTERGIGALESDGMEPPRYQLYDYETGEFKDVTNANRYDDGWSFFSPGDKAEQGLAKKAARNAYNESTRTAEGRAMAEAQAAAAAAGAQGKRRETTKEAIDKIRR